MNVLSYHNDPAVKAFHVNQAKRHYEADMLVAGTYGEADGRQFRGCSVGCMAHDINPKRTDYHELVAEHAGWPEWLVHLNDRIFEGLPAGARRTFHVDLREAIPVGANLEPVRHLLAVRRMDRLIKLQQQNRGTHGDAVDAVITQTIAALQQVRSCHEAEAGGNVCAVSFESAWSAAWSAAESAARSAAAESAARSAAAESAWSAARSAAWSARSAAAESAWSAAWSAAESAAWSAESAESAAESAAYKQEAADLLMLLAEATQG